MHADNIKRTVILCGFIYILCLCRFYFCYVMTSLCFRPPSLSPYLRMNKRERERENEYCEAK